MGRLKKEHGGYRTSGLWEKYKPLGETVRKPRAKKDTKKWCRGKVGVKHQFYTVEEHTGCRYIWIQGRCVNCGKKQWTTTII